MRFTRTILERPGLGEKVRGLHFEVPVLGYFSIVPHHQEEEEAVEELYDRAGKIIESLDANTHTWKAALTGDPAAWIALLLFLCPHTTSLSSTTFYSTRTCVCQAPLPVSKDVQLDVAVESSA
jgi:hypothetical protein